MNSCKAMNRRKHEGLLEKGEIVADMKRQLAARDDKFDKQQKEYEGKIKQQEERGDRYKELAKEKDREYKAEKVELLEEIRKLREDIDQGNLREMSFKHREGNLQQEIENLKGDLDSKVVLLEELAKIEDSRGQEILELKSEVRRLRTENEDIKEQQRTTEQAKRDFEDRSIREKRMLEDELSRFVEERERENGKQKEKLEGLKDELKKAWASSDKYKEEKEKLEIANERADRQKLSLEEEVSRLKEKVRQGERDKEAD